MDQTNFLKRLQLGEIVAISAEEWDQYSHLFKIWQSHDTGIAGELLLLKGPSGLVAVETPRSGQRVVRPLSDESFAKSFVQERLDTYERMWDG